MYLEFQMEETKDLSEPVIDNERMEIRSELSKMSMEEILRLKEELGSKLYNRAIGIGSSKKHHSKVTNKGKLLVSVQATSLVLTWTRYNFIKISFFLLYR